MYPWAKHQSPSWGLCPNVRPRLALLFCWVNQSLALKEGVFAGLPPQEACQHVHAVDGASGLQDGLPVRSSNLNNNHNKAGEYADKPLQIYYTLMVKKIKNLPLAPSLCFSAIEKCFTQPWLTGKIDSPEPIKVEMHWLVRIMRAQSSHLNCPYAQSTWNRYCQSAFHSLVAHGHF